MRSFRKQEKLKILMVVADLASEKDPSFQPFVKSQIQSIIDLGHEVRIFKIKGPDAWYHYFTKMPALLRKARDFSPDIVHSHYSYCSFTALASLSYPQVISFMGDDVLGDFRDDGRMTIKSYFHWPFAWLPTHFANQIIVKSKEMVKFVRHPCINVIPNGVDFNVFYPMDKKAARQKLGLKENGKYIIFPGDIKDERKRFSLAKSACEIVKKRYNLDHELLHMRSSPQNELNLFFNAADAMVFTSWSEGSPNVIKEAMASNLPIVSVFVGDVKEVISDTDYCYDVRDNPEIIAKHLYGILESGCRSNGRKTISHLKLRNVAKRLEQVYYKAVKTV